MGERWWIWWIKCVVGFSSCGCFFQAEDGIRDAQESRGLGDVYKRQLLDRAFDRHPVVLLHAYAGQGKTATAVEFARWYACLLYTSDAADDLLCVDLGGRRLINKKTIDQ